MKRIEIASLELLIRSLRLDGYMVIAPTVRNSAIVYDEVASLEDLPKGWSDEQGNGSYALKHTEDRSLFQFTAGPSSAKAFLFPPVERLFQCRTNGSRFVADTEPDGAKHIAFLGIRPCDAQAIARLDHVLLRGPFLDPHYQHRREDACIITVNCTRPGGTCFCASLGTGPRAVGGFDIALTEIVADEEHYLLAEVGSSRGGRLLESLPSRPATEEEIAGEKNKLQEAAGAMGRMIEPDGLRDLLFELSSDPHWEEIGSRCLTCANCTMVCPTCFCSSVEDSIDLTGSLAERKRRWDSCFTLGFSYIHGGSVRMSAGTRYRQWMTHKLASWVDQFGTPGCVGCGRCITWCPVGIDITEEASILRKKAETLSQQQHL